MEQIFLNMLSLSLSGALTGAVLLVIHPLTKKWFSKRWNYYIWLLVMARLVLPFPFETANSLRLQIPIPEAVFSGERAGSTEIKRDAGNISEPESGSGGTWADKASGMENGYSGIEAAGVSDGKETGSAVNPEKSVRDGQTVVPRMSFLFSGKKPVNWLFLPAVIWFLGAGVGLFIKIRNYRRFATCISRDRERVSDDRVNIMARDTAARLRMKQAPDIYVSGKVSGPITLGVCKPVIVLPKEFVSGFPEKAGSGPQLSLVLHHEFVHVKRKDLWYKWFYQVLLCAHWFNPILYLVARMINIDCELACDEAVVASLTEEGKKAYGNILINAAEWSGGFQGNIPSTTLLERRQDLKERLKGIIHYKKQKKFRLLVSVCMILGLLYLTACGNVRVFRETAPLSETADSVTDISAESDGKSKRENGSSGEGMADDAAKKDAEEEGSWLSAISRLFGYDADDIIFSSKIVNKFGTAWKMYDDDSLVAGEDGYDQWNAYSYAGGDHQITSKGFALNGSYTVLIADAFADTKVKVETSYNMVDGKFKIVCVKPDGSVELIDDTGNWGLYEVTLEKGRNVIKMVGQGAKLKELSIRFPNLNERDFAAVYSTEQEEYVNGALEDIRMGKTVDKEKILESLSYMEDREVSEMLAALLEQKESLTTEEMCDLFIYSDRRLSTEYLTEAVTRGDIKPDREMITSLIPYLDDGSRGDLLRTMNGELDWETLCDCMPYLDEEDRKDCVLAYLEKGNNITFSQYEEISPYLSDSTVKEIDRYLEGK